jgi:hypothetical protein
MNDLKDEWRYFELVSTKIKEGRYGPQVIRHADILNQKISGLLTHVSVMIAALAIIFQTLYGGKTSSGTTTDLSVPELLILTEMGVYVVVTLFCLKGIFLTTLRDFKDYEDRVLERFILIVAKRRKCYHIALFLTIMMTVAVVFTLISILHLGVLPRLIAIGVTLCSAIFIFIM